MNRLTAIAELVSGNLYAALAVALIVVTVSGYLFFFTSTIGPNLNQRSALIAQVADARKALVDAGKLSSPAALQVTLANARATLAASKSMFLSDTEASQTIDVLYQEASASGVMITDLQTQPVPTPNSKSIFNVTAIRLQAQGDSKQLIDFVSRMKQASSKGFVINNLTVSQDKTTAKLTMDITLYTTPNVSSDSAAVQLASTNSPAIVPMPQAPAPPPQPALPTISFTATPVLLPPTTSIPSPCRYAARARSDRTD
ncbi:MAG: hypothetical protein M1482_14185 [Chloroflexi bacterium]|nr:hypothetical protein [Chloroflexota bacterium]